MTARRTPEPRSRHQQSTRRGDYETWSGGVEDQPCWTAEVVTLTPGGGSRTMVAPIRDEREGKADG